MYYELCVSESKEEDYGNLIKLLNEHGIQAKLDSHHGKNMFDTQIVDALLSFSANVAANVLAGIIVAGLGKGFTLLINGRKVKVESSEDLENVINDINEEL